MNYLKYTQYVYLIVAIFFFYEAFDAWSMKTGEHWLFLIIALVCVFMFYFRRKFAKRFGDRNNTP